MKFAGLLVASVLTSAVASASPFLPSQGQLKVAGNCSGTTLTSGQKVLVQADDRAVQMSVLGQAVIMGSGDAAFASGHFCGLRSSADMCVMESQPINLNGALIFNGFTTMGGMGLGDPLPAGFLVDSKHQVFGLQLFDTGSGIEISGQIYPVGATDATAASPTFQCLLKH